MRSIGFSVSTGVSVSTSARGTSSARLTRVGRLTQAVVAASALALTGWAYSPASAQVVVQQVEEGIGAGIPSYAPIEFGGVSNTTNGAYPGVSLFAQAGNTNTYSVHAQFAANAFFGTGSIGNGAISQAYIQAARLYDAFGLPSSTPFYTNTLRTTGSAVGPVPNSIGNGVRVTNHSYVIQFDTAVANTEATRRADFLINRDNVVWTAGAVNGALFVGGDGTTTMSWQPRNGIAVRGDSAQTPFNPAQGAPGRQHADVWFSDLASFAAPAVGGYSAALIRNSQIISNTAAGDARVVKSLLMSGASKSVQPNLFNAGGPAWQPTTANNLDPQGGAGQQSSAAYTASLAIQNAGQRTYLAASGLAAGSTIAAGNVPVVNGRGWALGSIAASGSANVILVHFNGPVSALGATLNWNWTSQQTGTNVDTGDAALIAADLALDLRRVTWNGTQYVLPAAPTNNATQRQWLASDATGATNDNVEHLGVAGTNALSPGTYAFVIRGDTGSIATAAAFSYNAAVGAISAWNVDAGGNIATTGNWTGSVAPNGVSVAASFPNIITAARTVNVGANVILGSLSFSGSNSYTLNVAGASTLTLSNGAFGPSNVNVSAGSHTINAPVVNAESATVSFTGNSQLAFNNVTNTSNFSVTGAGTAAINGRVVGSGGNLVVANGGRLTFANAGNPASNIVVADQNSLTINGSLGNRSTVAFTGNPVPASGVRTNRANVAVVNTLSIQNDGAPLGSRAYFGFLDLGGSDMIVRSGSLANLGDAVRAWWNNGARNGGGIGSSLSGTAGVNQFTTIGMLANTDQFGFTQFASFDGVSLAGTDIILKYTYLGDVNLDGTINAIDINRVLNGWSNNLTGWNNGDTNYDGVINGTDYTNVLNALGSIAGNPLGDAPTVSGAIPEPAALGLLAAALPLAARRRRR